MVTHWKIALEIIGALGGITTVLALFLGPMFYLGGKIDAVRSDLASYKSEMHQESKEFHGRLCDVEARKKEK